VFYAQGDVNCEFQYGSSSDVKRGDGVVTDNNYPFTCRFASATAAPLDLHIIPGSLLIDQFAFLSRADFQSIERVVIPELL